MANPVYAESYSLPNPLVSGDYSAFHPVKATDFGLNKPGSNSTVNDGGWGVGNLAYNAEVAEYNAALTKATAEKNALWPPKK